MSNAYLVARMNAVIKSTQTTFVTKLASLSTKDLSRKFFQATATDSAAIAVLNKILMGSPKTAVETAVVIFNEYGLDKNDRKLRGQMVQYINYLLAETYEGHVVASNGLVLLPYLGCPPRWYANLSTTAQSLVKKVGPSYQGERCKLSFGPKVPAVIGQTYGSIRNGYLGFSGFGDTRWMSPWTLEAIAQRDKSLRDIALTATNVTADLERARAAAKAADERAASAISEKDTLLASMQATVAEMRLVNETVLANAASPALAENIQKMVQASVDIAISAVAKNGNSAGARAARRTRTPKVKLVAAE